MRNWLVFLGSMIMGTTWKYELCELEDEFIG